MGGLSLQSQHIHTDTNIERLDEQKKRKQASKWVTTAKIQVTKINYVTGYETKGLHKRQSMSRRAADCHARFLPWFASGESTARLDIYQGLAEPTRCEERVIWPRGIRPDSHPDTHLSTLNAARLRRGSPVSLRHKPEKNLESALQRPFASSCFT